MPPLLETNGELEMPQLPRDPAPFLEAIPEAEEETQATAFVRRGPRVTCDSVNFEIAHEAAFVINVATLVDAMEVFGILHEFVKNTAIAAMTLVSAGSFHQMANSCLFIFAVGIIYRRHEKRFDRLDISDFQAQVALYPSEGKFYNPASLLTSVGLVMPHWPYRIVVLLWLIILGTMWALVIWARLHPSAWLDARPDFEPGNFAPFVWIFVEDFADLDAIGMQLLILTAMCLLQQIFVFLHEYHTAGVFDRTSDGTVWDIHLHGIPAKFRRFGLPAMWFSTQAVKDRVIRHIMHAQQAEECESIACEELALFGLNGSAEQREQLAVALHHAEYVQIRDGVEEKHRLGVEVRFFFEHLEDASGFRGKFLTVSADDSSPDGQLEDVSEVKTRKVTTCYTTKEIQARRAFEEERRSQVPARCTGALDRV